MSAINAVKSVVDEWDEEFVDSILGMDDGDRVPINLCVLDAKAMIRATQDAEKLTQLDEEEITAEQDEFVAWLKRQRLYNSFDSAQTMRRMHEVWKAAKLPVTHCGKTAAEWQERTAQQAVDILRLRQACKDAMARYFTIQKYFEESIGHHPAGHCDDVVQILRDALDKTGGER